MVKRFFVCFFAGILFLTPFNESKSIALANGKYFEVTNQLNELINNHPTLQGAISGISIRSATSGELIYSSNGDLRLTPASNMKLFTASAALSTLGKDYTFLTEIRTNGSIKNNQLKGNLYLVGKGDPTLLPEDLNQFALALKKKGITTISGHLIGDDSWYDRNHYSIDVPWSDEAAYYGAAISALTVSPDKDLNTGTVVVEVTPGNAVKKKAKVKLEPSTDYVQMINDTITVDSEGENHILITREHGSNIIKITGTIPLTATKQKEWIAVWEPAKYVLDLFKQSLHKQGIEVKGITKLAITPKQTDILYEHQSMPLSKILIPFLKLSNNSHAEVLIKEMGKRFQGKGSWEAGLKIEKGALTTIGMKPEKMEIRDGSGISHISVVPANEVTQLLFIVQSLDWFPQFSNALPKAGSNDKMVAGTLRNRMKNLPLQNNLIAKTGTLTNVSSLSGYLKSKNGEPIIFSILLNHLNDEDDGKRVEDQIVHILANIEL